MITNAKSTAYAAPIYPILGIKIILQNIKESAPLMRKNGTHAVIFLIYTPGSCIT